jgi:benzoyl-CoA-dihydrodiol lyase
MATESLDETSAEEKRIDFRTSPENYHHWKLTIDGRVARLALDVDENATLFPGYELKLNSYDLGVDIELYDAVQRLRFEHRGCHLRQAAGVLRGSEYPHAVAVDARP